MLKSDTREIGGKRYCVTQLAAEPGQRLFFQLAKLIGPSVAALLREWQGKEVTPDTVAAALSEFVQSLTYAQFRDFVDTFMGSTKVLGTNDKGEETQAPLLSMKALAFAGDYGSLMKWIAFCLEVNYGSFFGDMGLTALPSAAGKPSA